MGNRFPMALLGLIGIVGSALLLFANAPDHGSLAGEAAPAAEREPEGRSGPPPLVIDEGAPLLVEEPAEPEEPSPESLAKARAKNSACFVCHANYREEPLVVSHAQPGIACTDCHGESFAHRNDENNTTPPDTMYPADQIDRSCQKCHATHDVPATEVVALWLKRRPQKTDPKSVVCTDCHGDHRLKFRAVRWDKKTGKLILGDKDPTKKDRNVTPSPLTKQDKGSE